jgi:tetratricopeptide (TPR) repeat protein
MISEMNVLAGLVMAPLLLTPPAVGPPERLPSLLAELRRSEGAKFGCLDGLVDLAPLDADEAARRFQRSRTLASESAARSLLAAFIEYGLHPSAKTLAALRSAHMDSGATAARAEDVCRCVYFEGERGQRAEDLTSIPPAAVGYFWAARVLHEGERTAEALGHYRRAREADGADPRTRLFQAIALIDERRPAEALEALEGITSDWAPKGVAYWRARALLVLGRYGEARALLEPLKGGWTPETTVPDASTDSGPVQPPTPPICALAEAQAGEGDEEGARRLLTRQGRCSLELGRLELRTGHPFEALLQFDADHHARYPDRLEALAGLKACGWARRDLEQFEGGCRDDWPYAGCSGLDQARKAVAEACPAPATDRADVDPVLEARLEEPRRVPFDERPVPPQWRWQGKRPESPPSVERYPSLPQDAIVALSKVGPRMFAVSISQDVDPRGEVSAGGYWLHLSSNRGRAWSRPYYLGFAQQFPYVVHAATRVPPFEGDRANLEVERREVDESTITFPPVALRAKNVARDLYLSIDLAAVRRDSDADGLTDLLEEKLLLDPRSADSDRDGLDDGVDPLPLQPRADGPASEVTELLAAVLPLLFGGAESKDTHILFVSGDGALFPHAADVRAIVLPPALLAAYGEKFGATYWMELADIAFDEQRQRALIRYDFRWRGGSLLAERKNGRWVVTPRSSWIT